MILYGSKQMPPRLTEEEDALYLGLSGQGPAPEHPIHRDRHYLADSLRGIAEKLDCDHQAARLTALGVPAQSGCDRRYDDIHLILACVALTDAEDDRAPGTPWIDAEAADRLGDRLRSGLAPVEAVRRTLAECSYESFTEAEVRSLERDAEAHIRRLDAVDRRFEDSLGSPEHRAAIAELP